MAGHWRQHQLWDGTYTIDDLLDIHEIMMVKNENEKRVQEHMRNRNADF